MSRVALGRRRRRAPLSGSIGCWLRNPQILRDGIWCQPELCGRGSALKTAEAVFKPVADAALRNSQRRRCGCAQTGPRNVSAELVALEADCGWCPRIEEVASVHRVVSEIVVQFAVKSFESGAGGGYLHDRAGVAAGIRRLTGVWSILNSGDGVESWLT